MVIDRDEVNMVDVAERAGVSIATVSRALSGRPEVNAATRERVARVAAELGYVVSPEASALSRRSKRRVAVVVPVIDLWFYSTMLAGIEDALRAAELDVMVYQVDGEEQRSRFIQDLPARRKVDAVVLIALPLRPDEEERLDLLGVQVVVAGGRIRDFPFVRADDRRMTELAMAHLLDLGHRRVAMIRTSDTDDAVWSSDQIRTATWAESLAAAGIAVDPDLLVTVPAGPTAGAEGMARVWDLADRPTAVLAYSDEIAISAIGHLGGRGVGVPGEVSIVGFDGHPMGESFGLTTVSQSVRDQGRLAGELAIALLGGDEDAQVHQVVDCDLLVRGTTGPVRLTPPDRA